MAGKRQRYSNPFRFYLTVSVIFFLILGLNKGIEKFKNYSKSDVVTSKSKTKKEAETIKDSIQAQKSIEQLKSNINTNVFLPEEQKKKIIEEIDKEKKSFGKKSKNDDVKVVFGGDTRIDVFTKFQKTHTDMPIDEALDSLGYEKTFWNRFIYDRAATVNKFSENKENRQVFANKALSYGSIALFVFLPFFTLFLKLLYIRRKYTYVDHLVFVFHNQTVFFMLFSIFFLIDIFVNDAKLWIFTILFLIYLFIAMKKFYNQGYVKTSIKFVILNLIYLFISAFGIAFVLILSFALF